MEEEGDFTAGANTSRHTSHHSTVHAVNTAGESRKLGTRVRDVANEVAGALGIRKLEVTDPERTASFVVLARSIVVVVDLRRVGFLENGTILEKLDATSHELMDVAEVENVIGKIVNIEFESDGKVSVLRPFRKGMEELGFVVIETEVVGIHRKRGNACVVTVFSEVFSGLEVHRRGTGHVIRAGTGRSRRSDSGLKFVDIGMRSIGVVSKAQGMVVVGTITLKQGSGQRRLNVRGGNAGTVVYDTPSREKNRQILRLCCPEFSQLSLPGRSDKSFRPPCRGWG